MRFLCHLGRMPPGRETVPMSRSLVGVVSVADGVGVVEYYFGTRTQEEVNFGSEQTSK